VLRPSPTGYLFEGYTDRHWVFGAYGRGDLRGYGPPRKLDQTRVRGRAAAFSYAPASGGIHAHHLILSWREGGFLYAISVHTAMPTAPLRAQLKLIAEAMRRYR
jgi:hypothetical protein